MTPLSLSYGNKRIYVNVQSHIMLDKKSGMSVASREHFKGHEAFSDSSWQGEFHLSPPQHRREKGKGRGREGQGERGKAGEGEGTLITQK